jgi:hypothetical protein
MDDNREKFGTHMRDNAGQYGGGYNSGGFFTSVQIRWMPPHFQVRVHRAVPDESTSRKVGSLFGPAPTHLRGVPRQ